jgi:membrane protein DedA with SNARE-associated domain
VGALIWAAAIGSGGYLFGLALQVCIGKVEHYEVLVFAIIALLGLLIWIVHFYHRRKRAS